MIQDPTFEIVEMTPEWAEEILTKSSFKNRRIRVANLERLVTAIEKDQWLPTSQGIALDHDGNLLDGQHRLVAVVKAKKSIKIMLARGLDPKAFSVLDSGCSRTAGDALAVAGCSSSNPAAAAIKLYIMYYEHPDRLWGEKVRPAHNTILQQWKDKREIIDQYVSDIQGIWRKYRAFQLSPCIAFALIADDAGWKYDEVIEYFCVFGSGANLKEDSPILSYRNQLANPVYRRRGSNAAQLQLNSQIKCFNLWKKPEGTTLKKFMQPSIPPQGKMLSVILRKECFPNNIVNVIPKSA